MFGKGVMSVDTGCLIVVGYFQDQGFDGFAMVLLVCLMLLI